MQQFVKDRLEPERAGGQGVYVLTDSSVSPTREVEVTEDGIIVEETIMALAKSAKFVDRAGNICDVALRTGRVLSEEPEAQRYEQYMVIELIRGGQLPLDACPFTQRFSFIRPGPLVAKVDGKSGPDCNGKPGGCEHMLKVIAARRAATAEKAKREQVSQASMSEEQVKTMMTSMAQAFGTVAGTSLSDALKPNAIADIKSVRRGLQGEGEKE